MNTPWFIGIPIWLLTGLALFAYFEARAFKHPDRQNTLSRTIYDLGKNWPLSIFLFGLIAGLSVGGLSVHFWWHWCPELMPAGVGG